MELFYILYRPANKQSRYILALNLGNRNGKLCLIETAKVTTGEVNRIVSNKTRLLALSLERRIGWIKDHCPNAYRKGYREIWDKNYQIVERYPMQ